MPKEPIAQYIVDAKGKRTAVIVDIHVYEQMLDELDDYLCAKAYDDARPKVQDELARNEYSWLEEFLVSRKMQIKKKRIRKEK